MRNAAKRVVPAPQLTLVLAGLISLVVACGSCFAADGGGSGWKQKLAEALPLYGHRNWICVVDSAYPAQARPAIETVATGEGQLEVVSAVLKALGGTRHVRPVIYTDSELGFLTDELAPGIANYRTRLATTLGKRPVTSAPHEDIIKMLDQAAETFRVLILKTNMVLPYTSVFMRLDCGYWPAESEQKLREAMKAGQ